MMLGVIALGLLCLAGGVQGQNARNTTACYGRTDCNSSMSLQCGADQHVFITKMLYAAKHADSACSTAPSCNTCCQSDVGDCFRDYTKDAKLVYDECWNKQSCTTPAHQVGLVCDRFTLSTFSVLEYICLPAGLVTEFHTNTSITAPAVAVHYDPIDTSSYPLATGDSQTWYCRVDCVQRQADVILVMESYPGSSDRCSSVGWSGRPFLPCVPEFQYTSFSATTPFDLRVMVDGSDRFPSGWAVVRALDGNNLTVTCGFTSDSPSTNPICEASPLTSTTTLTTMPRTTAETSTPSQSSAHDTSRKTPSSDRQSSTSSQPPSQTASSRDVTVVKVTTPKPMSSSSATGTERPEGEESREALLGVAVTGWVLAAVLGALFFISVTFLIRLRRRGDPTASSVIRNGVQGGVASTEVIQMEQTSHRSQPSELMGASSSRRAEDVNSASSHTDPASVYVNEASGRRSSSHAESRSDSQQEYSSLDWSRDQANPYTGLRRS